jgi:hypothetical protein
MLSPLTLLIAGLIVLLAALQLRLRWHAARRAVGKRGLTEGVDPETRDPPESTHLIMSYLDAPLLDYWGGPEPD